MKNYTNEQLENNYKKFISIIIIFPVSDNFVLLSAKGKEALFYFSEANLKHTEKLS